MIKSLHRIVLLVILSCFSHIKLSAQTSDAPKPCKADEINSSLVTEIHQSRKAADAEPWYPDDPRLNGKYIIPTVFHIFGTDFEGRTLDIAKIEEALDLSNQDFQGLRPDFANIMAEFQGIKEAMNIEFRLAKLDPDGNPTSGVTFNPVEKGFGHGGGYDNQIRKYAWDNKKYMNVYILLDLYNDGDYGNSGVAWLPDMGMTNANTARVVYNGKYVGTNTSENFRSVLTHEFGHYLGLRHTFNGGCETFNSDDGVEDTPKKGNSSRKEKSSKNCLGETLNVENFMDYTNYYAMFTRGQVGRMTGSSYGLRHEARITLWQYDNLVATGVVDDFKLGKHLVYTGSLFNEVFMNDGAIENSISIDAREELEFAKTGILNSGADYTLTNVPAGLTAQLTVNSSTNATLTLTGKAEAHANSDKVDQMTLTFLAPSLNTPIDDVYNPSNDKIKISFLDPYTSYCVPSTQFGTFYSHITGVQLKTIDSNTGNTGYEDFTKSFVTSAKTGESLDLTIKMNKGTSGNNDTNVVRVWADWNQNFIYEENERLTSQEYVLGNVVDDNGDFIHTMNITVPDNVEKGTVGLRVMVHYKNNNDGANPCENYETGEVEDYGILIIPSDAPFAADFVFGPEEVIFADPVSFTDISTAPAGIDIVKWEWSFPGGEPSSHVGQIPPKVYYKAEGTYSATLKVTNSNDETDEVTKENIIKAKFEYCDPNIRYGTYTGITQVKFGEIDNTTNREARHTDYFNSQVTELKTGETYPLTIKVNKGNSGEKDYNRIQVWIDWNYNSAFDDDELVESHEFKIANVNAQGDYTYTSSVTVPLGAEIQKVGMRVMVHYVQNSEGDKPCDTVDSGEIEDYGINITKGTQEFTANFEADQTAPLPNAPVTFSDISEVSNGVTITNWEWTFENGEPANYSGQVPPAISYSDEGNFDVSLTVTTSDGQIKTITKEDYIRVAYVLCETDSKWGGYAFVKNVNIGIIDNTTTNSNAYTNYRNDFSTNVKIGDEIPLSITVNTGNLGDGDLVLVRVWADWNYNAILEDNEQLLLNEFASPAKNQDQIFNADITVPDNAAIGKTIALRVLTNYKRNNEGANGCGTVDSGESEDYGLNIIDESINLVPDFIADNMSPVLDTKVQFSDMTLFYNNVSGSNWEWTFEGGEPESFSGQNPPAIHYKTLGDYSVTLEVTGSNGDIETITKDNFISVIEYKFCEPRSSYWGYGHIDNVKIGTIDQSNGNTNQYNNFIDSHNIDIKAGETIPLTITANTGNSGEGDAIRIIAWADWNYNSVFEKSEEVGVKDFTSSAQNATEEFTVDLRAPEDAAIGRRVALRVMVHYLDKEKEACDNLDSGEVEDYGLNIKRSNEVVLSVDANDSNISIFPNPTSGIVNINAIGETLIEVHTLDGQQIIEKQKSQKIDLSDQPQGIYILKIQSANKSSVFRLIKL
ncbi:M43 family zinc metalloprotease [Aureibacter tunicatorum]|uniref:PKD repeat protein n=1 Tax=Aureibacter tunicatorum TaxID=866807 RepID=A0AAE4BRG0_9BACT|nr:M43 family zinc metalloprotease [Aureibacter tunicatorum]MDR6240174.1 PKD repeat protein [Aureibacter tunicatorum]BDD05945.1 hypothetical protein AUTU_34280 [Aureibacter tunicatorum]